MARHLNYANTHFVLSAPDIKHLPVDNGVEIAFTGRSNAGKSSALNRLARQRNLARTSKIPGRTQHINLFQIEENCRIVDLPGYGYAKVPEVVKRKWQQSLSEYFQKRKSLTGLILFTDIRHPIGSLDQQMIRHAVAFGLPILLLLTKADKLSHGAQLNQLHSVRKRVLSFDGDITVEIFSSLKGTGLLSLEAKLDEWFCPITATETPGLG